MRLGQNYFPKSSFLATEKDYAVIIDKILHNQRLLKMLYYTQKDCLSAPDLNQAQILSMINNQIKLVPYLQITPECPIYILILMDNFVPNATNPEFRDCNIIFCILCHPDHWNLGNFQLRPQKIAGELDAMFNNQKLTGIGTLQLVQGGNLTLNNNLMGMTLLYNAIHGVEDERFPLVDN